MIGQIVAVLLLGLITAGCVAWGAWDEQHNPESWKTAWAWELGDDDDQG